VIDAWFTTAQPVLRMPAAMPLILQNRDEHTSDTVLLNS
jgi:hypothetical protein